MSFFNNQEENSDGSDMQWDEIKATLRKLYLEPKMIQVVSDQLMIQQQSDLMEQIREKIYRSHLKQSLGKTEGVSAQPSVGAIGMSFIRGDDQCLIKSKFTEEFEFSLVNSALKEVKSNCSQQTYSTMINYVVNNKRKECENLFLSLQKKNRQIEQLSLALIIKQNELSKFKQQINPYIAKAEYFEDEKKKCKKKNDQLMEKQSRIHKAEMALIFKEKLHQEVKKKSERLREFTNQIYARMKQIEAQLNTVWNHIMKEMERKTVEACCAQMDPKGCWKKQVMRKCRQKLLQERNLLKEQQKQLQKQYLNLQSISQQWRKLLNDKNQQNPSPNSKQDMLFISPPQHKERLLKINSMCHIPREVRKVYS